MKTQDRVPALAMPPTVQIGRMLVLNVNGERIVLTILTDRGDGYFECFAQAVESDQLSPMYLTMHESQIRELAEPVAA